MRSKGHNEPQEPLMGINWQPALSRREESAGEANIQWTQKPISKMEIQPDT